MGGTTALSDHIDQCWTASGVRDMGAGLLGEVWAGDLVNNLQTSHPYAHLVLGGSDLIPF